MLSAPGKVASLDGDEVNAAPSTEPDWQPYAQAAPAPAAAARPKAQAQAAAPAAAPARSAQPARVARLEPSEGGSSTAVKSLAPPKAQTARPAIADAGPASLLRATVD
jgi:hypothetical protein